MRVDYKPQFRKMLALLLRDTIFLTKEITDLFREDPYHSSLRNHPLNPPLQKYRTLSVDPDLRILFVMLDSQHAIFFEIGTHDQIYHRNNIDKSA
jgi:mRNA-degrading endonuclease YafQ of YafQ-DinJ toxin-antitoxin module